MFPSMEQAELQTVRKASWLKATCKSASIGQKLEGKGQGPFIMASGAGYEIHCFQCSPRFEGYRFPAQLGTYVTYDLCPLMSINHCHTSYAKNLFTYPIHIIHHLSPPIHIPFFQDKALLNPLVFSKPIASNVVSLLECLTEFNDSETGRFMQYMSLLTQTIYKKRAKQLLCISFSNLYLPTPPPNKTN